MIEDSSGVQSSQSGERRTLLRGMGVAGRRGPRPRRGWPGADAAPARWHRPA